MKNVIFKFIILFCFPLLAGSNPTSSNKALLKDMAKMDRAFIPVFYYVQRGEMKKAKKSIFYLNHRWQSLHNRYADSFPASEDWCESFRLTNIWLSDAYVAIDAAAVDDSFLYLDHVRYQMADLRSQLDLDYVLDAVWDFECSMEMATEVAKDQMLCLLSYCEFEELVIEMNESFKMINVYEEDVERFGWKAEELQAFILQQQRLEAAVWQFNVAIGSDNKERMRMMAKQLNETYWDYLAVFGDFIGSKTHYAKL